MRASEKTFLRGAALATLLFFGCATVRTAAPPPAPTPTPRVYLADPEVELWVEGSGTVEPAESAQALQESRTALNQALAGRGLDADDADAVLIVHERAVARTSGRKANQVLAAVGIVVIVVGIVVAIIASAKHGGSSSKSAAPPPRRAAPPRAPAAARPAPAPVRPGLAAPAPTSPRVAAPAPRGLVRPAPPRGPPAPIWRPGHGAVPAPRPIGPEPEFFFGPHIWFGAAIEVPLEGEPPPPPPPEAAPEPPPPEDDFIFDRGLFTGDRVELALELRDTRTGAVIWQHLYRGAVDPRNAGEVRQAIDQALAGQPWAVARPPSPAEATAPADAKTH